MHMSVRQLWWVWLPGFPVLRGLCVRDGLPAGTHGLVSPSYMLHTRLLFVVDFQGCVEAVEAALRHAV